MDNNIGKKFGKWTVLSFSYKDNYNHNFYKCKCECGFVKDVDIYRMKYGHSKSCPKCKYETLKKPHYIKRLKRILFGMRQRCLNPHNPKFYIYGARGIKICDDWKKDSQPFIDWALSSGYNENLTIDRIDNDGNYCPENCRWVSIKEQLKNRRISKKINYNNKIYSLSEFAKEFNLFASTVRSRYSRYNIKDANILKMQPDDYRQFKKEHLSK